MPETLPIADKKPSIWYEPLDLEFINRLGSNTLITHLGIVFTGFGPDWLEASMPVDDRTRQPFGLLHGGASLALAETVSSTAGGMAINRSEQYVVGMELNGNHLRGIKSGLVRAVATPDHLGRSSQVWTIHIRNDENQLVCLSRATIAVRDLAKSA